MFFTPKCPHEKWPDDCLICTNEKNTEALKASIEAMAKEQAQVRSELLAIERERLEVIRRQEAEKAAEERRKAEIAEDLRFRQGWTDWIASIRSQAVQVGEDPDEAVARALGEEKRIRAHLEEQEARTHKDVESARAAMEAIRRGDLITRWGMIARIVLGAWIAFGQTMTDPLALLLIVAGGAVGFGYAHHRRTKLRPLRSDLIPSAVYAKVSAALSFGLSAGAALTAVAADSVRLLDLLLLYALPVFLMRKYSKPDYMTYLREMELSGLARRTQLKQNIDDMTLDPVRRAKRELQREMVASMTSPRVTGREGT
ncbi:hypothetical protein [Streptomyces caelestis]|uniref:hypothetical protein n=1 Tax=Streptomyces caelestis TaxID=36816 RepID=UPI00364BA03B